jgi:hypothetical protein
LLAGAVVGFCGLLYVVKATLPGQSVGNIPGGGAVSQAMYALSSVSLALLPAALLAIPARRRTWRSLDVAIGAEIGLLVVGIRAFQAVTSGTMPAVLLGDLASQWGVPAPGIAPGARPPLFTPGVWGLVGIVALVATVVVPAVTTGIVGGFLRRRPSVRTVVGRLGSPAGLLAMFTGAVALGLLYYCLNYPLFDRYHWPIVPVLAILFLRPPAPATSGIATVGRVPSRIAVSAAGAVGVLTIVSAIFLFNSAAFDGARWRGGQQIAAHGISPDTIDAGYEWVGYHQAELPIATDLVSKKTLYEKFWPGRRQCAIVSSSDDGPAGATPLGTIDYDLFLIAGPTKRLYLYQLPACVQT